MSSVGSKLLHKYSDNLTLEFDAVDHAIKLHELKCHGIRGHVNMFLRSYRKNRLQYTTISD